MDSFNVNSVELSENEKKELGESGVTIEKVHTFRDAHNNWIVWTIHFNQHERLVSCSQDKRIRVWDLSVGNEKACLHTFHDKHTNYVRFVAKFNDEVFISCGDDGRIFAFSVLDFSYSKLLFDQSGTDDNHKKKIFRVMRLREDADLFCSLSSDESVRFHSFSERRRYHRVVQVVKEQPIRWHSHVLQCDTYPDCIVYSTEHYKRTFSEKVPGENMNHENVRYPILVWNFKTKKFVRGFTKGERFNSKIRYSFTCYKQKRAFGVRELLVVVGSAPITFFDMATGEIYKHLEVQRTGTKNDYFCLPVEKYLFIGKSDGSMEVHEMRKNENDEDRYHWKRVLVKKVFEYHDDRLATFYKVAVRCLTLISKLSSVRIIASTQNSGRKDAGEMMELEVGGLELEEGFLVAQVKQDLMERVYYVWNNFEEYFFEEEEENDKVTSVKCTRNGVSISGVFKWMVLFE